MSERISETITFHFDDAEQQKRFHERLDGLTPSKHGFSPALRAHALLKCEEALREAEEYFAERADADGRPDGSFVGNDEMKLLVEVRAALTLLDEARHGK